MDYSTCHLKKELIKKYCANFFFFFNPDFLPMKSSSWSPWVKSAAAEQHYPASLSIRWLIPVFCGSCTWGVRMFSTLLGDVLTCVHFTLPTGLDTQSASLTLLRQGQIRLLPPAVGFELTVTESRNGSFPHSAGPQRQLLPALYLNGPPDNCFLPSIKMGLLPTTKMGPHDNSFLLTINNSLLPITQMPPPPQKKKKRKKERRVPFPLLWWAPTPICSGPVKGVVLFTALVLSFPMLPLTDNAHLNG